MGENDFDDVELAENLLKFQSRHEFILAFHESQSLNQHLNTQLRREYGAFAFDRELAGWVGPGTSPRKSTATNAAKTPFVPIVGVKIIADLSGEHLTTLVPCYESDPVNTFQAPEGYVITGFRSTVQKYVTAIQFVCHRQTEQGIDLADSQSSAWFGTPQGEPVLYGGQHPIVGFWIDSSSLGMKSLGIFHQPQ
jgi:hypothetical protein